MNLIRLIEAKVSIDVYPNMEEKPSDEDKAVYCMTC